MSEIPQYVSKDEVDALHKDIEKLQSLIYETEATTRVNHKLVVHYEIGIMNAVEDLKEWRKAGYYKTLDAIYAAVITKLNWLVESK